MRAKRMLHLSLNQGSLARSVVAALCLWAQQSGTTGGPRGLGSGSQLTAALGVGGVFLSGPLKPREPSSALNQAFSRQSVASEGCCVAVFSFPTSATSHPRVAHRKSSTMRCVQGTHAYKETGNPLYRKLHYSARSITVVRRISRGPVSDNLDTLQSRLAHLLFKRCNHLT